MKFLKRKDETKPAWAVPNTRTPIPIRLDYEFLLKPVQKRILKAMDRKRSKIH